MTNSIHTSCPKCGAPIPENAPQGLCPKCVLAGAATLLVPRKTPAGKTPAPTIAELAPHFPELEILEEIGVGGMGAVYKARQPQLDRFVALKILSHDLAGDPAFVERFNREARVLGRLNHPNIVGIHDFGTAGPYCYLLMEYVDGVNLRQAMRAGRFTPTEALEMVQHLCTALKFAHEEGILHRDIKPENILIDTKGRVKIADFGIAKLVGGDRQHDVTLTMQGSVLGTPHYMAPEQIETPGDVDQRADIYSLGVVLYEMLTGGLPIGRFALPSEKAEMDARIDHIVMRTLEKEREARYQSAGEVGTEVEAVTKHPAPPSAKPAASHGAPGAARFSLAAAILTGISIPLAIIVAVVMIIRVPEPVKTILAVLPALAALCCAVIGFILGARALGEIRRSGGVKTGLGSAIFGVTVWPILFLFSLATVFIKIPILGNGLSLGPFSVIFIVMLPVLAAAWLLVRSLYRWAGGVERNDGTRFHPGLGMPLLMVMLLTIAGPLLLAGIASKILPAGHDPHAEERRFMEEEEARFERTRFEETIRNNAERAKTEGSGLTDWYRGGPEVYLPLLVHPRYRAEFRLVQYEVGNKNANADVGTWVPPSKPDSKPRMDDFDRCHVFVGTSKTQGDVPNAAITVQLGRNNETGNFSTTETDFTKWNWNYEPQIDYQPLHTAKLYSFEIASREESVDGISKVTGKLVLEVQLIERKP